MRERSRLSRLPAEGELAYKASLMTSKDSPTANPAPGTLNAVSNDDGSITIYLPSGCWYTRYGGYSPARQNNPGALVPAHANQGQAGGCIGADNNGKAIFESPEDGETNLRAALTDALRLTGPNTNLEDKLYKVASDNGWGNIDSLMQDLYNAGVDVGSHWNGPYYKPERETTSEGINVPVPIDTTEAERKILDCIAKYNGYSSQYSGSGSDAVQQTSQECPDTGSYGDYD